MSNSTMVTKEYLLAVVSAVLSEKEIPDLPKDIDVTQFVRLAFTNAVQGIVFSAFAENPDALPEALFARLKKSFQAGILRDAAQAQMLSVLREQLNDAGIDFLLLKGALKSALPRAGAAVHGRYGHFGARTRPAARKRYFTCQRVCA